MCLVALAWKAHPEFPLVLSTNRDEFFERPSATLHQWESGFYGGKDLRSGGTWMGFHPNGRWALLTNYRDFNNPRSARISRGKLVQAFLENEMDPESYLQALVPNLHLYDGFNLLVSDGEKVFYLSNYAAGIQEIQPGIHGLSNALINDPWPKVELAKQQLREQLDASISQNKLLHILKSTDTYPLEILPQTGVAPEMEIGLSAQLIRLGDNYGTVSAMAVTQNLEGFTQMKQRIFERDYHRFEDTEISFQTLKKKYE
ncbi:NRDE family protein [Algoriphagus namhaensis]|uniref:NRDE family protein n=1 Tax=Algoriphagus namhaensis TaxID=915353 RepID=A0ABV8AN54_9BACT